MNSIYLVSQRCQFLQFISQDWKKTSSSLSSFPLFFIFIYLSKHSFEVVREYIFFRTSMGRRLFCDANVSLSLLKVFPGLVLNLSLSIVGERLARFNLSKKDGSDSILFFFCYLASLLMERRNYSWRS